MKREAKVGEFARYHWFFSGAKRDDLGGGFKDFLFSPLFGEDSHFD